MTNRRTFLCGLTLGTLVAPLAAGAQRPAKALGLTIPQSLLGRADEVIQ